MAVMSKEPQREEEPDDSAFERFEKLAKALFRVDKRDVPKHEPKKRRALDARDSSK
jgi:hypothetical protein